MLTRLDTVSLSISMVTFAKSVNAKRGWNRASANTVGSNLIPSFFRSCAENSVRCCLTSSTQPLNFELVKPDWTWKYSRTNFSYRINVEQQKFRRIATETFHLSSANIQVKLWMRTPVYLIKSWSYREIDHNCQQWHSHKRTNEIRGISLNEHCR